MATTSDHRRSKSFPNKKLFEDASGFLCRDRSDRVKLDVGCNPETENRREMRLPIDEGIHKSLKQEIFLLEKRLREQLDGRRALEEALGLRRSSYALNISSSLPKPAAELIKEIAVLEMEVTVLEQYLLSLYRKAFDSKVSSGSPSSTDKRHDSSSHMPIRKSPPRPRVSASDGQGSIAKEMDDEPPEEIRFRSVPHCRLALVELSMQTSAAAGSLAEEARGCRSPPLPIPEDPKNATANVISLAEHLGARISDLVPETPNRISEDMVKCICAIYSKLSNAPLPIDTLSSPCSMSSRSAHAFSPRDRLDSWSPVIGNSSSFDVRLENPFNVQGLGEFSGPYNTMVEVNFLYQESRKSEDVNELLQNYRLLITRLENVDPRKLSHEEKLAFWVNIHNALVMHAFLAYGIPRNNAKRLLLLLKAAYNICGHTISAGTIQSSILGCRMPRPGQWLRLLLSSRSKFKTGDERQAYAIDGAEPLLHFALSCGSHSDPAVRLYTARGIFQELEAAKEEYIRATFGVGKDNRLLLPKVIESFAKDSGLSPAGIIEVVHLSIPSSAKKMLKRCEIEKHRKNIEWVPHNFSFRYLISKELIK
ncbi:hypothetical protein MLD38_031201 [Melastoma candidum]|uniref:Uncharacterized protein n=1 Tax=Melastoma candidum TaxID=119954 RepID=A0ACB9MNT6_9MYRT|nr:hypothetical protein MLD38_031201 [Melastoma candidum]